MQIQEELIQLSKLLQELEKESEFLVVDVFDPQKYQSK